MDFLGAGSEFSREIVLHAIQNAATVQAYAHASSRSSNGMRERTSPASHQAGERGRKEHWIQTVVQSTAQSRVNVVESCEA